MFGFHPKDPGSSPGGGILRSIVSFLTWVGASLYYTTMAILIWDCGVVVSHPLRMRRVPGSNPGDSSFVVFVIVGFLKNVRTRI